jgi:hypothetical protein
MSLNFDRNSSLSCKNVSHYAKIVKMCQFYSDSSCFFLQRTVRYTQYNIRKFFFVDQWYYQKGLMYLVLPSEKTHLRVLFFRYMCFFKFY